MGCCESKKEVIVGINQSNIEEVKNYAPRKPLKLSEFTYTELVREIDFQIVCITKPELSYILKVDSNQLEKWTLYNLEVQIIEDLKDHMIESFRFSHMNDIQKSFYNQKLLDFMDLLPIYIELSVDETMEYIQIEIPHSNHVINIPYENNATIKYIKKKISEQVQLENNMFELVHQGEILLIDDMSLQDCKIYPSSKIIVQEITNTTVLLPMSVLVNNKRTSYNQEIPPMIKRMGTLDISQDLTINNITKIMTKVVDEDQTQEILDNFEIISTKSQDYHNQYNYQRRGSNKSIKGLESNKSPVSLTRIPSKQEKLQTETAVAPKSYQNFQVNQGLNVLAECLNSSCSQYKNKQMIHLNQGEYFMNFKEQELLAQCSICQKSVQINEILFYHCSYIISGIYKLRKHSSQQLCKQNDCQWINTKEDHVESYDFQVDEKDWKSVRIRTRNLKRTNKIWCCFCTRAINQQKDNFIQLTCSHSYHEDCIQKLKEIDSTCVMCVF